MACGRRAHSAQWKHSESAASKALAPPRVFIVSVPAERVDHVALVRLPGRYLKVGDLQVLVERLADSRMPVGEPPAVGLGQQPTERHMGGGLVGAGLPEQAFLAGDWVGTLTRNEPLGSRCM